MYSLDTMIKSIVQRVCQEYSGEWDEVYQQAYLIALEEADGYEKGHGATFETYMYGRIYGKLRHFMERVVIKESLGNGHRLQATPKEMEEALTVEINEAQIDSRDRLRKLYKTQDSIGCSILDKMLEGYTQAETARELGLTRQMISKRVKRMREALQWQ